MTAALLSTGPVRAPLRAGGCNSSTPARTTVRAASATARSLRASAFTTRSPGQLLGCVRVASRFVHTRGRGYRLEVSALGFNSDGFVGGLSINKQCEALLRDASQLLVYQSVQKDPVVQCFLRVCRAVQSPGDGCPLFLAYGDLYRALLLAGQPSILDHVLDLIVRADGGNAYALEAAKAGGRPGAALVAAAEADLEALQALCISESNITKWVKEIIPETPAAWMAAAPLMGIDAAAAAAGGGEAAAGGDGEALGPPLSPEERAAWRARVGDQVEWKHAAGDLAELYAARGAGPVGTSRLLAFEGGVLVPMPEAQAETWAGYEGTQPLAPYQGAWSDLVRAGGWHVLLAGPSGSGKTRMLVAAALSDASTRVVAVPRSEVKNLAALGVALAEHPRACFVVVLENLAVTPGEVQWVENCFPGHTAVLSAVGGDSWPENAAVYASCPRASGLREGADDDGALASCFPRALELQPLSEAEWRDAFEVVVGEALAEGSMAGAVSWARGALTSRTAKGYFRQYQ